MTTTIIIVAILTATHVAAFFAGAHNATRAKAIKDAVNKAKEAIK